MRKYYKQARRNKDIKNPREIYRRQWSWRRIKNCWKDYFDNEPATNAAESSKIGVKTSNDIKKYQALSIDK